MDKFCKILCLSLVGLVSLLTIASLDVVNAPIAIVSQSSGTVVGYDANPIEKFGDEWRPNIRIQLASGLETTFRETSPLSLHVGDRVNVVTWKWRFWGYKTTFESQ